MNSLRSDSISYFVAQIAFRNQRLNNDSKDLHSSKDLLVRIVFENSFEKLPFPCHPERSRGISYDLLRSLHALHLTTSNSVATRDSLSKLSFPLTAPSLSRDDKGECHPEHPNCHFERSREISIKCIMTQDEKWMVKYEEVVSFIEDRTQK